VGLSPPGGSQCEEELEQVHRRLHAHEHLAEVGKDRNRGNGMQCQVVELKTIVVQQHEEDGGHRERELSHHVGGKEDNLIMLQVSEQNGSAPYPPIVLRRLPSM
jgi:hypothetical protein